MTTAETLDVISGSAHVSRDLNTNNLHDATAAVQYSHCSSSPHYRQLVNFVDLFIWESRIHRHASHTRGRSAWKCYAKTPRGAVVALRNSRLQRLYQATYDLSLSNCKRFLHGHSNRRRDFSAILGLLTGKQNTQYLRSLSSARSNSHSTSTHTIWLADFLCL